MSLAFSHDDILSGPASSSTSKRRTPGRAATVDLAFILAFVAFAIVSILVVATQPESPPSDSVVAAFAEL